MARETKIDKARTAILIIDMQNDLVKDDKGPYRAICELVKEGKVIENISQVVAAARRCGLPIFFVKMLRRADSADVFMGQITDFVLEGVSPPMAERAKAIIENTPGSDFAPGLEPQAGDYIIEKRRSSSFCGTDLELLLRRRGIDTLILTGIATSACVESTAREAADRDFNTIVVSDSTADMTREAHDFSLRWTLRRIGRVRSTTEIVEALGS